MGADPRRIARCGVIRMQANMTRPCRPIALKIAVSLCVLGAILGDAQQPTKAQEAAIRSACQEDFASHCSGVKPGGSAALSCLQQNAASLSPACQTAVSKAPTARRVSKRQIVISRARGLWNRYKIDMMMMMIEEDDSRDCEGIHRTIPSWSGQLVRTVF